MPGEDDTPGIGENRWPVDEDEALTRFLNTYDKDYSMFNERLDKLRKSTSREKNGQSSSAENRLSSSRSYVLKTFRNNFNLNSNLNSNKQLEDDCSTQR